MTLTKMNNVKRVEEKFLKIGDCLKIWCGNKIIVNFEQYNGIFDFVARVAVFYDGSKMSLTKGDYYSVIEL